MCRTVFTFRSPSFSSPYRVERGPIRRHRRDVVHVSVDGAEQFVHGLVLRLAALMESPHQLAIHLDGLADIQKSARSASEKEKRRKEYSRKESRLK